MPSGVSCAGTPAGRHFVVLYFLPRVLRHVAAAGRSPSPWVATTSPKGRRGPHVAAVPSIWSEPLHALRRAARRRGRERCFDQDQSVVHDSQHQRVQQGQESLEWIRVPRNVSCVAREGTCPTGIEHCRRRFDGGLRNGVLMF